MRTERLYPFVGTPRAQALAWNDRRSDLMPRGT